VAAGTVADAGIEKLRSRSQNAIVYSRDDWPEPFGLVMIEAMACGTPVLGFRCGSVSETIDDNVAGRVVASVDEAVRLLPQVIRLDRRAVRRRFEDRFSASRMATDYLESERQA
jgi:glycosyltransferase involved in cell wall biosynthesis